MPPAASDSGWLGTPPSSPSLSPYDHHDTLPVIATDEVGMEVRGEHRASDEGYAASAPNHANYATSIRPKRRPQRPQKHVSRHFQTTQLSESQPPTAATPPLTPLKPTKTKEEPDLQICKQETPAFASRIINGLNIDDLSSDSSLTDVPDDIGPDPFASPAQLIAIKTEKPHQRHPTRSPYWPHPHKSRPHFLSCLPFPPLSTSRFGLMQERLSHDPFRLLIATIFLNKTPGARAMPVFYTLMERYPTPGDLASADVQDVVEIIRVLGFQNQRARKCVAMSKKWVEDPPVKGRRWRKVGYPVKGDGRDVGIAEAVGDEDKRVAWEISHLPGLGAYAHDSWRIFCRDRLRGTAEGWNGEGVEAEAVADPVGVEPHADLNTKRMKDENDDVEAKAKPKVEAPEGEKDDGEKQRPTPFEPEWKRVLPTDKELRAWMTWMWLKEGWIWNKETGQRTRADAGLMERARGGGIVKELADSQQLVVSAGVGVEALGAPLETPTGAFGLEAF